jgi:hypothetical protein
MPLAAGQPFVLSTLHRRLHYTASIPFSAELAALFTSTPQQSLVCQDHLFGTSANKSQTFAPKLAAQLWLHLLQRHNVPQSCAAVLLNNDLRFCAI